MNIFSRLCYAMWGFERAFGGDFTSGSRLLLEDWVQVACSQKTWRLKKWRRRYDFNRLISCFDLTLVVWKIILWKLPSLTNFNLFNELCLMFKGLIVKVNAPGTPQFLFFFFIYLFIYFWGGVGGGSNGGCIISPSKFCLKCKRNQKSKRRTLLIIFVLAF